MDRLLNHTSAQELDATLRCSILNKRPFSIDQLRASLDNEQRSAGARKTIIKLLEREIKRQENANRAAFVAWAREKLIERECCGTAFRSPHRSTCPKFRGKKPA